VSKVSADKSPWVMAVYLMADGPSGGTDLDKAARATVQDIKKAVVKVGGDIRVAIQIDFKREPGTFRVLIERGDEELRPVQHPGFVATTRAFAEQNAGASENLADFFEFVDGQCGDRRCVVHLWGHSNGPVGLFTDAPNPKAPPDTLTLPELRRGFARRQQRMRRPVDVAMFKNCWMSTLETAFQLEGTSKYIIASPGLVVPFREWPYEKIFKQLVPDHSTETVARNIFAALGDFYDLAENRSNVPGVPPVLDEVSWALLDLDRITEVTPAFRELVAHLTAADRFDLQRHLRRASRGDPALVDMILLCKELQASPHHEVSERARQLLAAVRQCFVVPPSPKQSAFGGISAFYFPDPIKHRAAFKASLVAPQTDPRDYVKLAINETGWPAIATENIASLIPANH
jgi:Clostripain family